MRSVVDRNVVMQHMTLNACCILSLLHVSAQLVQSSGSLTPRFKTYCKVRLHQVTGLDVERPEDDQVMPKHVGAIGLYLCIHTCAE
jgi:hypothetical protein